MARDKVIIGSKAVTSGVDTGLTLGSSSHIHTLTALPDVSIPVPNTGSILIYDGTSWTQDRSLVARIDAIAAGMVRGVSVLDVINEPVMASVADGDVYLVSTTPSGVFAGQANKLAFYYGGEWKFIDPELNSAHLIERDSSIAHWNGTAWNRLGGSSALSLGSLNNVDVSANSPSAGDTLVFDNGTWKPSSTRANTATSFNIGPIDVGNLETTAYTYDIGRADWSVFKLEGTIGLRSTNSPLAQAYMQFIDATGIRYLNPKNLVASCQATVFFTPGGNSSSRTDWLTLYPAQRPYAWDGDAVSLTYAALGDDVTATQWGMGDTKAPTGTFRLKIIQATATTPGLIDIQMDYMTYWHGPCYMRVLYCMSSGFQNIKQIRFRAPASTNTQYYLTGKGTLV